jgi:hypothetical protein
MTTATPPQQPSPASSQPSPPQPARTLLVFGTIVVAIAIVAVIVVLVAGLGRDDFHKGSVTELESALRAKGVSICSTTAPDSGSGSGHGQGGALSTQVLHVSNPGDCGNAIDIQIDTWKDAAHRDAAARNAEMQERQRNFGVVYTWHQFTIYLQADDASTSTGLRDHIVAALAKVGAN